METDKIAHLTVGTGFYLLILLFTNLAWAIGLTVLLGFFKEVFDRSGLSQKIVDAIGIKIKVKKTFEFWDMVATIIIPLIITSIILI